MSESGSNDSGGQQKMESASTNLPPEEEIMEDNLLIGCDEEMSEQSSINQSVLFSYTCPICLGDSAAISKRAERHYQDKDEGSDSEEIYYYNLEGIPIFTLAATCQHKFCAPCLRAFIQSKLLVGNIDISCCHYFRPTAGGFEKEPDICNVVMAACDIKRLIHLDYFRRNSSVGDWTDSRGRQNTAQDCNKIVVSDELWAKYKRIEFDRLHGKDVVRRCPSCDEAALFDVDAMKLHLSTFEEISRGENATTCVAPLRARSRNNRTVLDRFLGIIRQTQDSNDMATTDELGSTDDANNSGGRKPNQQILSSSTEQDQKSSKGHLAEEENEENPTVLEPQESGCVEEIADEQINTNSPVKSKSPVINCISCNSEFCYFHSNAHVGKSCVTHLAATLEADRTNIEYANRVFRVKPCPNCGISVSKEGGCNQIKCSSCGTHFCWLCSTIVDDGPFPEHFRWWNLSGCPNMQMDESTEPMRCTVIGARLISVLQLLVLGVPAMALTIASMLVCPCLIPECGRNMRERVINCTSFWGSCLSSMIMLPFTFFGILLVASLYCFAAAISFCWKIPKQTFRRTPADNEETQQSATEELIRELENIFRLEEGSLREGVELTADVRSYQDSSS